jgi:hypothetical protein
MPANAASVAPPMTYQRAGRTALMATRIVTATITTVHVIGEFPGLDGLSKLHSNKYVPFNLGEMRPCLPKRQSTNCHMLGVKRRSAKFADKRKRLEAPLGR